MADGKLHGKNGAIYVNGVRISNKTEWALNMSRDYADVSTFRDRNKVYAAGLKDIQGTFAGLFDIDGDAALLYSDGVAYNVQIYASYPDELVAEGLAYVDASVTAAVSDAVRCTGNFRAAGPWTVY